MFSNHFVINLKNTETINLNNNEKVNIYLIANGNENIKKILQINLKNKCEVNVYCLIIANNSSKHINFNLNHNGNESISNINVYALANNHAFVNVNCVSLAKSKTKKNKINQTINGLIFDDESMIKALPSLDIYVNEIDAKHTVNIGQIDPEIIFYLNSKGLNNQKAYSFLINSFISQLKPMLEHNKIDLTKDLISLIGR